MNLKLLILIAILSTNTSHFLYAPIEETEHLSPKASRFINHFEKIKQKLYMSISKIKNKISPMTLQLCAKSMGTIFLIWLAFNATILAHELGHGLTYKAITGSTENTKIFIGNYQNKPYLNFSLASIPIHVCSHYKGGETLGTFHHPSLNMTKLQKIFFLTAGPLAGSAAGYTMMAILEMYEKIINKSPLKEILITGVKAPYTIMKTIEKEWDEFELSKQISSFKSPAKSILLLFLYQYILMQLTNLIPSETNSETNCDGYKIFETLKASHSTFVIAKIVGKCFYYSTALIPCLFMMIGIANADSKKQTIEENPTLYQIS